MKMEALIKAHGKMEKLKVSENYFTNLEIWHTKDTGLEANSMVREK